MGLFSGIQGVRSAYNKDYLRAGHYLMRIEKIEVSTNRTKQDIFIIKMTVLHVFAGGPPADDGVWHRVGEAASDCISSKQADYFLPKIKGFIAKVCNVAESEVDETICEEVSGPQQPLKGLVIEVLGNTITTVSSKKRIVVVDHRGQYPASRLEGTLTSEEIAAFFADGFEDLAARQAKFGIPQA